MLPGSRQSSVGYDYPAWTPPLSLSGGSTSMHTSPDNTGTNNSTDCDTGGGVPLPSTLPSLTGPSQNIILTSATYQPNPAEGTISRYSDSSSPTLLATPAPARMPLTPRLNAPFSEHLDAQYFRPRTPPPLPAPPPLLPSQDRLIDTNIRRSWFGDTLSVPRSAAQSGYHLRRPRLYAAITSHSNGHELAPRLEQGEFHPLTQDDALLAAGAPGISALEPDSAVSWLGARQEEHVEQRKRRTWYFVLLRFVLPALFVAGLIVVIAVGAAGYLN